MYHHNKTRVVIVAGFMMLFVQGLAACEKGVVRDLQCDLFAKMHQVLEVAPRMVKHLQEEREGLLEKRQKLRLCEMKSVIACTMRPVMVEYILVSEGHDRKSSNSKRPKEFVLRVLKSPEVSKEEDVRGVNARRHAVVEVLLKENQRLLNSNQRQLDFYEHFVSSFKDVVACLRCEDGL